jgi:hypothetical protein
LYINREQFCSTLPVSDCLEQSRAADVVYRHIPKHKAIADCPKETSMRNLRLLSTTAAVLLLGAGAVCAQDMKKDATPGAPAAQQNAPAEKVAPTLKSDQGKMPGKTGQAAPMAPESQKKQQSSQTMDKGAPAGAPAKSASDANQSGSGATSSSGKSADEAKPSAVGQSGAGGSAKLTTDQRTKMTAVIMEHKVAPVQLNVSISVGTRVPESVHFYALPEEAFVIYPEWRGYDYILVGNQIIVIDPRSHEIVGIIDA